MNTTADILTKLPKEIAQVYDDCVKVLEGTGRRKGEKKKKQKKATN